MASVIFSGCVFAGVRVSLHVKGHAYSRETLILWGNDEKGSAPVWCSTDGLL